MENNQNIGQMSNSEFNILMFTELSKLREENNQTKQNMERKIEQMNTRIDLLDARQTAFDNRQNLFDLRLNTQDNKILFMSQQIENIRSEAAIFLTNLTLNLQFN
jgi:hypothetical protein